MASYPAHDKKDAGPSVRGWQLIALGLLSVFVVYASPISEAKGYDLFLFVGLSVGVVLVAAGLFTLVQNLLSSRATKKKEANPSVQGWWLIALGLLSPFLAGFLAGIVLGEPTNPSTEAKGYLFLFGGLLVGVVLVAVGLLTLLMNLSSSRAEKTSRGEALPDGDPDHRQGVGAAAGEAPRPWTLAGVMVASIGWGFVGGFILGPLLGLAGGGLAAIGRAKGERNAHMVIVYALVVMIVTLIAYIV